MQNKWPSHFLWFRNWLAGGWSFLGHVRKRLAGSQTRVSKKREPTVPTTSAGVLLRSWRCVPRAHVVATAGSPAASQQHGCTRMRLHVRIRAVLAGTDALCIACMSPVDGPVKKPAVNSLYMAPANFYTAQAEVISVSGKPWHEFVGCGCRAGPGMPTYSRRHSQSAVGGDCEPLFAHLSPASRYTASPTVMQLGG